MHFFHGNKLFRVRDTPIVALYRLYECTCIRDEISIVNEVMYIFYHNDWLLEDFPDPKDGNKARYTVLAAIMASLVRGFNRRYYDSPEIPYDPDTRSTGCSS